MWCQSLRHGQHSPSIQKRLLLHSSPQRLPGPTKATKVLGSQSFLPFQTQSSLLMSSKSPVRKLLLWPVHPDSTVGEADSAPNPQSSECCPWVSGDWDTLLARCYSCTLRRTCDCANPLRARRTQSCPSVKAS